LIEFLLHNLIYSLFLSGMAVGNWGNIKKVEI